jgi:methionine sulfoxide reductase heme-binding subunit
MIASSKATETDKTFLEQHPRLTNHLVLGLITWIGCIIALMFAGHNQSLLETLSIGTGYIGIGLIAVTLLMGPLNMLKVRKNPVNINARRDVGIWGGATALAHVFFSVALQLSWGSGILGLFLNTDGSFKFNLFGISNVFGLIGALTALFLLVLSNNYFLKKLKGKNWKKMQRFNYLLFGVAMLHTFTQQANNGRSALLVFAVIMLAGAVVMAQSIGFVVYRQRTQQRNTVAAPKAAPVAQPQPTSVRAQVAASARVQPQARQATKVYANRSQAQNQRNKYQAANQRNKYQAANRGSSNLPKMALLSIAGLLAAFIGFEAIQQGPAILKSIAHSVDSGNSNTASNSTSSSNSGFQVSNPSSNQRPVRTRHS